MNCKYVGPTVPTYELSKHPLHLLIKLIQVVFFYLGLLLLVGVTQQHPLSVPESELECMHVLCNTDSQFNFTQQSRRKKNLCFKDILKNVRFLWVFSIFSVSAWWHDLWTLEWHSLPMRAALYSACLSRCLSTLIWLFCWDWTWSDGWSNDSSGQDTAALTLPPPLPSLWTPKFWGVLRWYLGVWTFLRLVLWRG